MWHVSQLLLLYSVHFRKFQIKSIFTSLYEASKLLLHERVCIDIYKVATHNM